MEGVTEVDVVDFEERGVLDEHVGVLLVGLLEIHPAGHQIGVAPVLDKVLGVILRVGGRVAHRHAVDGVAADGAVSVDAEVPVLVAHAGVDAEEHPGVRAVTGDIAVGFGDDAVAVAVDEHVLDRISVRVVGLLIEEEGVRSEADAVEGGVTVRTAEVRARRHAEVTGDVLGRQLGDLRILEGDVAADGPVPVLRLDGNGVEGDFDTLVDHLADVVDQHVGEVGTHREVDGVQQVEGAAVVSLDGTGDAVADETEVQTGVPGLGGLPSDIRVVGDRGEHVVVDVTHAVTHTRIRRHVVLGDIRIVVAADILLARAAPSETELEGGDGAFMLQEFLVLDIPGESCGREQAPAVLRAESGRGVLADGEGEEVLGLDRPVDATEEGNKYILFRVVGPDLIQVERSPAGFLVVVLRVVVTDVVALPGITGHHVEVAPVEIVVVVGVGLEQEVAVEVLVADGAVRGGAQRAVGTELVVLVALCLRDVITQVDVEAQVLETVDLVVKLQVADAAHRTADVVVVVQGGHRACGRHRVGRAVSVVPVPESTVGIVHRLGRVEPDGSAHGAAVGPEGLLVDALHVHVDGQMVVQELRREAEVGVDALVVAQLGGRLVQVVAEAHAERELAAAVHAEVVVRGDTDTVDLILPVGVGRAEQEGIFGMILVHRLAELVAAHHVEGGDVLLGADAAVVGHLDRAAAAFLRGDDDDAVGSAGAVDGGRGGVLQHGEALDVVGVDRGERIAHAGTAFTGHGHAVDDDERVVVGGKGCGAADADRGAVTGLSGSGHDMQTGDLAHEGLARRGDRAAVDFVVLDGDDGARHIAFLHGAVADDHDLVEELVVLKEGDMGGHFGCLEGLRDIADAAHFDDGIRRRNPEGEIAVQIRDDTVGRARLDDGGTDHGADLVDNHTLDHMAALGECGGGHHAREHDGRKDG